MICLDCRRRNHEACRGGNWCDCQHKPPAAAAEPPPEPAMSWLRQG